MLTVYFFIVAALETEYSTLLKRELEPDEEIHSISELKLEFLES